MARGHDVRCAVRAWGLPVAILGAMVAGCSATAPRQTMANAQQAILHSEESDGHQYAPLDMRLARERYEKAEKAMDDEDYTEARRLAEKALVDAQLAEAKAEAAKAQKQSMTLRESVQTISGSEGATPGRTQVAPAGMPAGTTAPYGTTEGGMR